jgi:hypothetical protein
MKPKTTCTHPLPLCEFWNKNLATLDHSLHHAAINGCGTKLDIWQFCPWCGARTIINTDSSSVFVGDSDHEPNNDRGQNVSS